MLSAFHFDFLGTFFTRTLRLPLAIFLEAVGGVSSRLLGEVEGEDEDESSGWSAMVGVS